MRFYSKKIWVYHKDESCAFDISLASSICGVSEKTVKRWINKEQKPHPSAERLLRAHAFGLLPDANWQDWRIINGELTNNNGWHFKPGDLNAFYMTLQLQKTLEHDNKVLKSKLDKLENPPPAPLKSALVYCIKDYLSNSDSD